MNCGTANHEEECLCDVHVTEPTPINFGLTDTWHGEAIARAMGVGVPWRSCDVADFAESLLKAYDIWARDERRGEPIEGEVLRIKVCDLLQAGESMTDVATILGKPWATVIRAMTNGVPATVWAWDEHDWLSAEAVIYDSFKDHGAETLVQMLGGEIHRCVVEQLAEWYGVKINENGQERLDLLKGLLRDGMHPLDAVEYLGHMDIVVSREQLYMLRKRLAERGEVASPLPRRLARAG